MLNSLSKIFTGAVVGALVLYFTMDWQEENLIYSLTNPAKFGDINYQNLSIQNTGWNPAININVVIDHPAIKFANAQSKTTLKNLEAAKNGVASIERIRRDETVVISLAYKGEPLFGNQITIASDRSLAEITEQESGAYLPTWATMLLTFFGATWVIGILAAIAIPSYKSYIETAKAAKALEEAEANNNEQQ